MTEKKNLLKSESKEIKRKQQEEKKRLEKETSQQKRLKLLKIISQEVTSALDAISSSIPIEQAPI